MQDNDDTTRSNVHRGGIVHTLARVFNGVHWAFGITTLPATAKPREERSFVLMWLGIIVFMIVFFAVFVYFLARI